MIDYSGLFLATQSAHSALIIQILLILLRRNSIFCEPFTTILAIITLLGGIKVFVILIMLFVRCTIAFDTIRLTNFSRRSFPSETFDWKIFPASWTYLCHAFIIPHLKALRLSDRSRTCLALLPKQVGYRYPTLSCFVVLLVYQSHRALSTLGCMTGTAPALLIVSLDSQSSALLLGFIHHGKRSTGSQPCQVISLTSGMIRPGVNFATPTV